MQMQQKGKEKAAPFFLPEHLQLPRATKLLKELPVTLRKSYKLKQLQSISQAILGNSLQFLVTLMQEWLLCLYLRSWVGMLTERRLSPKWQSQQGLR